MIKRHIYALCAIVLFSLLASVIASKWEALFQRGNPIPYLTAVAKLSEENTFESVDNMENIYITKRGVNDDLFQLIQDTYDVEYKDQLGSGYLFSDGVTNYIVGSEIYWGRFTVWTLSFDEGFPA